MAKKKTVIIINGRGGSGKDTICDVVGRHYKTFNISTIDEVKAAALCIGWNGGKEPKDRAFLSELKALSIKYYNHPFNQAVRMYNFFINSDFDILFIHVREPSEIEKLRRHIKFDGMASVYTLLVLSERATGIYGNHSDDEVEDYTYDYTFVNDCRLEQLDETFMTFFEGWK